jgi:hypothetical protein
MKPYRWILFLLFLFYIYIKCSIAFAPVIILHYSNEAKIDVKFFYIEGDLIIKSHLFPGQISKFFVDTPSKINTPIHISLPEHGNEYIDIAHPFSRVDIYINSEEKIAQVDKKMKFFDRFTTDD